MSSICGFSLHQIAATKTMVNLTLWVRQLGPPCPRTDAEKPDAGQQVEETAQTFPTPILGNTHKHRRWSTRLPGGVEHWSQRSVNKVVHIIWKQFDLIRL